MAVPDPHQARGRRNSLQAIVILALTGVMAGAWSWTALAQWARDGQHKVRLCGPPRSPGCPGRRSTGSHAGSPGTAGPSPARSPCSPPTAPAGLTPSARTPPRCCA
ncbi:hypothetical protein E4P41_02910 [Geodermatophilus sp. DF01-2]|nr:hypothetical protein E4P41_02910 [Geodermatophilus sp. DF01_2]